MNRVASELDALSGPEKEPNREFLLLQGVRFAFRVHQVWFILSKSQCWSWIWFTPRSTKRHTWRGNISCSGVVLNLYGNHIAKHLLVTTSRVSKAFNSLQILYLLYSAHQIMFCIKGKPRLVKLQIKMLTVNLFPVCWWFWRREHEDVWRTKKPCPLTSRRRQ